MNKKLIHILTAALLLTCLQLSAETLSRQLAWGGTETVWADSSSYKLISLSDAVYLARMPYAQIEVPANGAADSEFALKNLLLADLTAEEVEILNANNFQAPEELSLSVKKNGDKYILGFWPFLTTADGVKKLVSFDIEETVIQHTSFTQAVANGTSNNSVMRNGKWVKMRVPASGIYKLTYNDIVSAGIDPSDLHLYGYGGALLNEDIAAFHNDDLPQCPYAMYKGADGVFNAGDYILFYAQGPISWNYNNITKEFLRIRNPYSDYGYYFLASGTGEAPLLVTEQALVQPGEAEVAHYTSFTDHLLYESELLNLAESGRELYGEELSVSTKSRVLNFQVPNIDVLAKMVLRVNAAVKSSTSNGEMSSIKVNVGRSGDGVGGNETYTFKANNILSSDYYTKGVETGGIFYGSYPFVNVPVTVTLDLATTTAKAWINYVTMTAVRNLTMTGEQMSFRVPQFKSGYANFSINSSAPANEVWNITSVTDVKRMPVAYADGVTSFDAQNTDGKMQEYVMVNPAGNFSKPEILGGVGNQNLHSYANPELVIITNAEYIDAANRVADVHRAVDKMNVVVATAEQVYNEFSSGTPDASAYRMFVKMFYDRYKQGLDATETKYLLLYGDGTYDNRQVLGNDGYNKLLTYQSYASLSETVSYVIEDYFGFLSESGSGDSFTSTAKVDVSVGRLTVSSKADADAVADKLVGYINNKKIGKWKNQVLFFGDDGGNGDGIRHVKQCDSVACRVINRYPEFQTTKLYLDAFQQQTSASGESYPEAKEKFWKMIKSGVLYLNYVGHGGANALTNEKIVTNADLIDLYNEHLAFWTTATCNFSRFDAPVVSAGEYVLINKNGGGIGLFSTTRTVYSDPNYALNREFVVPLFGRDGQGKQYRVGDLLKYAKNNCTSKMYDNKLSFVLLGDPALRLAMPAYDVHTESINGKDVKEVTVGALETVEINGSVRNGNEVMTDFNGVVYVSVFDKEMEVRTLDNHDEGAYNYMDRSCIFSGKTSVVNGRFTISMMLPKDINYSFGDGKVIYYAADEENNYEANGYDLFTVGGFAEDSFDDEEGPQVEMCLNTNKFRSGDVVAQQSLFVAYVSDESGINISGVGIGHDVALRIDNGDWILLNDYYESDLGTFKSGVVKVTLPEMDEGEHTLTFRVWDLLNNSTSKTINFRVSNNATIKVSEVFCYPNPVKDHVTFAFRHDRPEEVIDATLHIFDLTGRELWEYKTEIFSQYNIDGNMTTIVDWDLTLDSGGTLRNGTYLYTVEINCTTGKEVTKTKKMIVAK